MLTSLLAASIMTAPAAAPAPPVDYLAGNFTVVRGTLVGSPTPSTSPQTITVNFNGSDHTYNNIYLVGSHPSSNYFQNGGNVLLILAGSAPLKATSYDSLYLTFQYANVPNSQAVDAGAQRQVPVSQAGVMHYGVAFSYYVKEVTIITPGITIGPHSFPNGVTMSVSGFPASYSIQVPTISTSTSANVWFPQGGYTFPYIFDFLATGPKTQMSFVGHGSTRPLTVQGSLSGTSNTFDKATFKIASTPPAGITF